MEWYAIVHWGNWPHPSKGPFKSVEEAEEAIGRFYDRYTYQAGEYMNAGAVRIIGPFSTREIARDADISETVEETERRWLRKKRVKLAHKLTGR